MADIDIASPGANEAALRAALSALLFDDFADGALILARPLTVARPITSTYASITALGAAVADYSSGTATYVPGDTLTAVGGTGTDPTFTIVATKVQGIPALGVVSGGTTASPDGHYTVIGTTGTGTKFTALVNIQGGTISDSTITYGNYTGGFYTVNPTTPSNEPVVGEGFTITGASVSFGMWPQQLSVATSGSLTVLPSDPVSTTGGSGAGAQLNISSTNGVGWAFSPTIVSTDRTSGFAFDLSQGGIPEMTSGTLGVTLKLDSGSSVPQQVPAVALSSSSGPSVLSMQPQLGTAGESWLMMFGAGDGNDPTITLSYSNGVMGAALPVTSGKALGEIDFTGAAAFNDLTFVGAVILARTTEDWNGDNNKGTELDFSTVANATNQSPQKRLFIDGLGNTNILNGGLVVGTPTGGSQGAGTVAAQSGLAITDSIAIASLPASPGVGWMRSVHDALAPAIGVAVASGGAANALVWWNGAQWTVWGI
jgi:hypothetical protein